MEDELSVAAAASALGTTKQTIRNLLHEGELVGDRTSTGAWRIRQASLNRFLAEHGRLDGGRRRKSRISLLEAEVRELSEQVARLERQAQSTDQPTETDDLRTRIITLEDALAVLREAAELQREAEGERTKLIDDLVSALSRSSRADALRREALHALEDGLARSLMPGHPGAAS